MVLYISGEQEKQALKNALGYYLMQVTGEKEDSTAKILARVIQCELLQDLKEKTATPKSDGNK